MRKHGRKYSGCWRSPSQTIWAVDTEFKLFHWVEVESGGGYWQPHCFTGGERIGPEHLEIAAHCGKMIGPLGLPPKPRDVKGSPKF